MQAGGGTRGSRPAHGKPPRNAGKQEDDTRYLKQRAIEQRQYAADRNHAHCHEQPTTTD
jgi:hypothetical protein